MPDAIDASLLKIELAGQEVRSIASGLLCLISYSRLEVRGLAIIEDVSEEVGRIACCIG